MANKQKYLTPVQLGRFIAEAWLDPQLANDYERDPTNTLKNWALNTLNVDLERASKLVDRPNDLKNNDLQDIANGTTPYHVYPNRFC